MGFSIAGTLIAIAIFIPNLLIVKFPPNNAPKDSKDAGFIFTLLERIGQVGCILILVISKEHFKNFSVNIWAVFMGICILLYYFLWIRYVIKGQEYKLLWDSLVFIPIPMAVFPVGAFLFAAILGESIWLGILVIFLGIGHFANSWHSYKELKESYLKKDKFQ
ncbi:MULTISPECIES: hypothetical protein [unclassified Clostridium]|uniref:hypothetical protein n=1 Tax=unclassified Clostridium TaxID=2614128 RepID=UPI001EEF0A38|nr:MULTISPECIES: hypothetical protein [unclassified Clostridium]